MLFFFLRWNSAKVIQLACARTWVNSACCLQNRTIFFELFSSPLILIMGSSLLSSARSFRVFLLVLWVWIKPLMVRGNGGSTDMPIDWLTVIATRKWKCAFARMSHSFPPISLLLYRSPLWEPNDSNVYLFDVTTKNGQDLRKEFTLQAHFISAFLIYFFIFFKVRITQENKMFLLLPVDNDGSFVSSRSTSVSWTMSGTCTGVTPSSGSYTTTWGRSFRRWTASVSRPRKPSETRWVTEPIAESRLHFMNQNIKGPVCEILQPPVVGNYTAI